MKGKTLSTPTINTQEGWQSYPKWLKYSLIVVIGLASIAIAASFFVGNAQSSLTPQQAYEQKSREFKESELNLAIHKLTPLKQELTSASMVEFANSITNVSEENINYANKIINLSAELQVFSEEAPAPKTENQNTKDSKAL